MIPTLHPEVDNDLVDIVEYYSREAGRDLAWPSSFTGSFAAAQIRSATGLCPSLCGQTGFAG